MGAWGYGIYQNDIAMDFISKIYEQFCNKTNPMDIILEQLNNLSRDEQLLVLADFELFVTGKIFYTSEVMRFLNRGIDILEFHTDSHSIKRKNELLTFKEKILDSKNSKSVNRTDEEIKNWFKEKEKLELPF